MSRIGMVGLGKLGLPVAVTMAMKGHDVLGFDIVPARMTNLPQEYQEAGPDGTGDFNDWLQGSLIRFGSLSDVVAHAEIVFVAVQTPHDPMYEGVTRLPDERIDFDYSYLCEAMRAITQEARQPVIVAIISTVLPGTIEREIIPIVESNSNIKIVYNPSFIAMGTTMRDFLDPEFVLVGTDDDEVAETMQASYKTIGPAPVRRMSVVSAELTKVAYNTYISLKIAFANTVMEICDKFKSADCDDVMDSLKMATTRLISPAYLTGGMGDGGGCFPQGEIVITEYGPRPIEQINVGDKVLTAGGALRPVMKTYKREFDGDLIGITVRGCPETWMTDNHPVFARPDGRKLYESGRRDTRLSITNKMGPVDELAAGHLTTSHLMGWPSVNIENKNCVIPSYVTPEYLELAGWWLSEGSAELTNRRGRLRFDLHAREVEDGERITELLVSCAVERKSGRGANAAVSVHTKGNSRDVRFGNKGLAERLVHDFGKGAADKFLPPWVLWGSRGNVRLVLRGMLRGDGCVTSAGIAFSSISQDLGWGMYVMLATLGFEPNIRFVPERTSQSGQYHNEWWEVRVRNRDMAKEICGLVGWDTSIVANQTFSRFEMSGRYNGSMWRPIRKLNRKVYKGIVHNLWVDKEHSYVVGCGAVHNCHPRDNIAMSWLARTQGLSFDLFEAAMLCREKQAQWLARMLRDEHKKSGLPVVILGEAFKPETNLIDGSPAILVGNILREWGIEVIYADDNVRTAVTERTAISKPGLFLIGCRHQRYETFQFPVDSIIIDPHRYILHTADQGYEVRRLGEGHRNK